MQNVYFVNSGSEANDLAMIMARMHTQRYDMLCLRNAYHGMSIGTMGTCGQHTWKQNMPQVGFCTYCFCYLLRKGKTSTSVLSVIVLKRMF